MNSMNIQPEEPYSKPITRRHFMKALALGMGTMTPAVAMARENIENKENEDIDSITATIIIGGYAAIFAAIGMAVGSTAASNLRISNALYKKTTDVFAEQAERLRQGTVKFQTESGYGTGFILDEKTIVTCSHVCKNDKKKNDICAELKLYDGGRGIFNEHQESNILSWIEIDPDRDLAILRFSKPVFSRSSALSISRKGIEYNEPIISCGMGLEEFRINIGATKGRIDGIQFRVNKLISIVLRRSLISSERGLVGLHLGTNPGDSGGPIMNHEGEVIGIAARGGNVSVSTQMLAIDEIMIQRLINKADENFDTIPHRL